MTNPNSINFQESTKQPSKYSNFVNNTKKAVRDTLIKTWIAASTMAPMATTTTSTVLPASVNTITAIAPTASSAISTISLWTAAGLLTACGGGEDGPDTPVNPIDKKDTVAPTINVNLSEVDITWWKEIRISWNQLYIWDILVASRNDNQTKNCKVFDNIVKRLYTPLQPPKEHNQLVPNILQSLARYMSFKRKQIKTAWWKVFGTSWWKTSYMEP